jgi:hypothetical protein
MANLNITDRSTSGIVIFGTTFENEILTATGAEIWPAGAVLGRVTADNKLVRFDDTAVDGSQTPLAVLTVAVEFEGAGDRTERPAISGQVRRGKLVDAYDTALDQAAIDMLRGFTIVALNTYQTSELDNQ